jgi:hypothetical protein
MDEEKGFLILEAEPKGAGGILIRHEFISLPARPMLVRDLVPESGADTPWRPTDLRAQLGKTLSGVPRDSVLRVQIHGSVPSETRSFVGASRLRGLAPPEMNLEVSLTEDRETRRIDRTTTRSRRNSKAPGSTSRLPEPAQHRLDL